MYINIEQIKKQGAKKSKNQLQNKQLKEMFEMWLMMRFHQEQSKICVGSCVVYI